MTAEHLGERIRQQVARLAPDGRIATLGSGDDVALGVAGLGFDSVRLVELLLLLEDELGVELPAAALPSTQPLTLGGFAAWVGARVAAAGRAR
ncbi:MAG: phosphopantetheine-binding protein [Myxococcota bacterium]